MIGMMNGRVTPVRNNQLLNLTVYLTLMIMVSIALTILPDASAKVIATAVCLAFGLVHRFGFPAATTARRASSYFSLQTLLVTALILVSRISEPFNFPFYMFGHPGHADFVEPRRGGLDYALLSD